MLKRVLLLVALLISLGSATSFAASNLYYMGTIGGISYYIDKDTVQKYGTNAYVWVKVVTNEGSEVWGHILVSRYAKAYTITELRGDGGEQKLDPHEEFRPMLPNSPIEKIVELIW